MRRTISPIYLVVSVIFICIGSSVFIWLDYSTSKFSLGMMMGAIHTLIFTWITEWCFKTESPK